MYVRIVHQLLARPVDMDKDDDDDEYFEMDEVVQDRDAIKAASDGMIERILKKERKKARAKMLAHRRKTRKYRVAQSPC